VASLLQRRKGSDGKARTIELLLLLILISSLYVGWNIGANDTANCMGPTVGSGIIAYRQATILVAAFAILGAFLQGDAVVENVGRGIVTETIPNGAILIALLSAGVFVTVATIRRIPVSTAQAIIGAIAGIGVSLRAQVSGRELLRIVECWLICPVLAMIMSYVGYRVLAAVMSRVRRQWLVSRVMRYLMILASCYVAYSLGANNVGNATGLLANMGRFKDHTQSLTLLGGAAIAVGALTFGKRVTMTVGKSITPLNVPGALCAQFAAAFGIHLFALMGVPVSSSQAVVGAVLGVGLVKGARTVSKRTLVSIAVGWVTIPLLAGGAAFFACKAFYGW